MILLLLALIALQPNGSQQQKPSHYDTNKSQDTDKSPTAQSSTTPSTQRQAARDQPPTEARWFDNEAEATWALVVVGILGTVAAICTLLIIRKQTKALMDADHAMVLIMWTDYAHVNPEKPTQLSHCFQWDVRNGGKSPAFIEKINSRLITLNKLEDLPRFPVYKSGPKDMVGKLEPLLPDKDYGRFYAPIESDIPYQDLEKACREKTCVLYAYGFIKYRDMYRRKHETRFGIVYNPKSTTRDPWRIAGPRRYNRHT